MSSDLYNDLQKYYWKTSISNPFAITKKQYSILKERIKDNKLDPKNLITIYEEKKNFKNFQKCKL